MLDSLRTEELHFLPFLGGTDATGLERTTGKAD